MKQFTEAIPAMMDGIGREQDRRTVTLDTAWLIRGQGGTPRSSEVLAYDTDTAVPVDPAGPTLVILADAVPGATRSAAAAVHAGGRVYALAPDGWGEGTAPEWFTAAPPTGVLVRRLRRPPAAAVLSGGRAWLWTGPDGPGRWRLALTEAQMEAFRLAFLDLYWNEADDEAWPEGKRPLWRPRGDAPFDLPTAEQDAAVRVTPDRATLPAVDRAEAIYSPGGDAVNAHAARIWRPPSGDGHADLARLARTGCEVVWSALDLPLCMAGPQPMMVASSPRWSMRISLTPWQAASLTEVLGQVPDAVFRTGVALGFAEERLGPEGRVWIAGRPEPERLIGEQVLDAGTVQASALREMQIAEPPAWPPPAELALTARWHWRVGAPQAARDATDDPLVKAWRALDRAYADRVKAMSTALTAIEKKESALEQAFATLKGALLGFGRSREGLGAQVRACEAVTPSADGAEAAREHLARLADLEERARRLEDEVAAAEWDAKQKAERERQEQEHERRRRKAGDDLREHEEELAVKRARLTEVEVEIGELAPDKADMPKRDRKARQRRLRDERTKLEKRTETLERLTEELQETIDKPFEFRAPTRPGHGRSGATSFVPAAKSAPRVPEADLPAVGQLLCAGKERFLAVHRWDELDRGEEEAQRLDARLVTIKESQ